MTADIAPIRPVDIPKVRADLLEHYERPATLRKWASQEADPAVTIRTREGRIGGSLNPSGELRLLLEIKRLQQADLYFVSAAMTEVAVAAAATLPTFVVEEFDLPSRHGLIVFEKPVAVNQLPDSSGIAYISAAAWGVVGGGPASALVWLSFYTDQHHAWTVEAAAGLISKDTARQRIASRPRYRHVAEGARVLGQSAETNGNWALDLWGRAIVTSWLLSQQAITEDAKVAAPRAESGSAREATSVRVVELRRRTVGEQGQGVARYRHRWLVKGHWRQHWFPKQKVHRPVWIAPHVKGPEGAPLLGGDKVYAWKR